MLDGFNFWYYFRSSIKYIELLTAIIATYYYYKYKKTPLKYFIYILWYIVFNEFLGKYIRENITLNNSIVYNLYYVTNFTFLFYIYYKYIKNKKVKKIIIVSYLSYIISFIINGFFENYLVVAQGIPYILAASLIVFIIGYYFYEILNSDNIIYINKKLLFWFSTGQILFLVSVIPTRIVSNYYATSSNWYPLFYVKFVMIVVMNICFILGFIWSKKD